MIARGLLALTFLTCFLGSLSQAEAERSRDHDGLLLGLSGGFFDAIQREDEAEELRIELRYDLDWYIKPMGGLTITTDQAAYVHLGVYSEFFLTDSFYISPSFGPGLYMKGEGKDLGHVLEFRSQIAFGWRFENAWRAEISLNHLSNAGFGRQNPGSETIALTLSFPLYGYFD